jgi:prepilin signal peptidase PulO-like enzyme (type II secretory pathway)
VGVYGVAVSVALAPIVHLATPWVGLSGAVAGLLSMSLLRLFGRVGCAVATMGRGDVLIAAMVGAAAGPEVFVGGVQGCQACRTHQGSAWAG